MHAHTTARGSTHLARQPLRRVGRVGQPVPVSAVQRCLNLHPQQAHASGHEHGGVLAVRGGQHRLAIVARNVPGGGVRAAAKEALQVNGLL